MNDLLVSICSGLIGVLLTIGYQHFFSPPTTVNVYINDEEYSVTENQRVEIPITTNNEELQDEVNKLKEEKSKLSTDIDQKNNRILYLEQELNNKPNIDFKDIGLTIDAQDIPINKNNSMVTIDGKEYFSREITKKLIPDIQNMTIKDDTLFIGKVIADTANLFDQWISDRGASCYIVESIKDSYGNLYSNCLLLTCTDITFNTQGKYSLLKCDIAMSEELYKNCNGVLTIKADGNSVYSVELNKLTKPFTEVAIPINNCTLLNISYDTDTAVSGNGCIIANATLYNE